METKYSNEELIERVVELENALFNMQLEMQGFIRAKETEINSLTASLSWRVTKPLRLFKKVLKKLLYRILPVGKNGK